MKVSKMSPQNNSKMIINEKGNIKHDKEITRERYISPEERQKFIDDLRII